MAKIELTLALLEVEGCDVSRIHVERGKRSPKFRCPWHNDDEPSAVLYATGNFKCYGCGLFGDCWDILRARYGLNFPEAQQWLADRGIDADRPNSHGKPAAVKKEEPERQPWRMTLFGDEEH